MRKRKCKNCYLPLVWYISEVLYEARCTIYEEDFYFRIYFENDGVMPESGEPIWFSITKSSEELLTKESREKRFQGIKEAQDFCEELNKNFYHHEMETLNEQNT